MPELDWASIKKELKVEAKISAFIVWRELKSFFKKTEIYKIL